MRRERFGQPVLNGACHRRGAASFLADMQRHQFVGCRQIPLIGVMHLVEVMNPLLVERQQAGGEAQRIAGPDLAPVGNMSLERKGRDVELFAMRPWNDR